ncbi:zf-HC2 domain-containing protein [Melioribacteraceae bacterium 4301-Me]|uniref:zf-HC2 domain-containing protein n=1 Tax=Pyranulibacter aquaticus TaxID=3163344 RepID=UPI00359AF058
MNDFNQNISASSPTCKDVMNHICDNLGEELDSPKCVEIKAHLEHCDNCKKYFKSIETTIEFYKKYNVSLSEEAHNKLLEFLGLKQT